MFKATASTSPAQQTDPTSTSMSMARLNGSDGPPLALMMLSWYLTAMAMGL
jgi:hypothetical protein